MHQPTEPNEIPIERLIDGIIRDCLAAGLPPFPMDVAIGLGRVFAKGQPRDEFVKLLSELLPLIIERIERIKAAAAGTAPELLN